MIHENRMELKLQGPQGDCTIKGCSHTTVAEQTHHTKDRGTHTPRKSLFWPSPENLAYAWF